MTMLNSRDKIEAWLIEMGVIHYHINDDLCVDVDASVFLENKGLKCLPVQFGRVNGHFDCSNNKLTSLACCPDFVYKDFTCLDNKINHIKIKNLPNVITGNFHFEQDLRLGELESLYDPENKICCTLDTLKKTLGCVELHKSLSYSLPKKDIVKKVKI